MAVDSRSNDRWFQHVAIIVSDMDKAYARLRANRVRHASTGPQTLRACTHLDVSRAQVLRAAELIGQCLSEGLAGVNETVSGGPYARG